MQLIDKIEKKYGKLSSEWVVPEGKVEEVKLIRELTLALRDKDNELSKLYEIWNNCRVETQTYKKKLDQLTHELERVSVTERDRLINDICVYLQGNEEK